MKIVYKGIIFLFIVFLNIESRSLYIENHYEAAIEYRVNKKGKDTDKFPRIGNGATVRIGSLPTLERSLPDAVHYLEIRAINGYFSSGDLDSYLKQIETILKRNPAIKGDAVLVISPSSFYQSWLIDLRWEQLEASQGEIFSMIRTPEEFLASTSVVERLAALKQGVFGQDYANKVTAICSANYQAGVRLGKINLCENLKRSLIEQKVPLQYKVDLAPTIEEIKTVIDRNYRVLQRYKNKGWAR